MKRSNLIDSLFKNVKIHITYNFCAGKDIAKIPTNQSPGIFKALGNTVIIF